MLCSEELLQLALRLQKEERYPRYRAKTDGLASHFQASALNHWIDVNSTGQPLTERT